MIKMSWSPRKPCMELYVTGLPGPGNLWEGRWLPDYWESDCQSKIMEAVPATHCLSECTLFLVQCGTHKKSQKIRKCFPLKN